VAIRLLQRIPALIAALGIVPVAAIVLKRAVDVPYWDEWEWSQLVFAAHRHTLTFARLWEPHNEHRILIPNLMMLGLDALGGWTPVREQLISLALLALTQLGIWLLICRTVPAARRGVCFLASTVLLLGLAQYENLDWGFQMAWFLCDLAAVAVVVLLTRPRGAARDLALAAVIATVASLSSSQGLLAWPVGLLAIWLVPRGRLTRTGVWAAAGIAVTFLVRAGAPGDPQNHVPLSHVGVLAEYVLAYLGAPLATSYHLPGSLAAGGVLLLWLAALTTVWWQAPPIRRVRLAPWLALAAYSLAAAAATAPVRAGLGLEQATSSRYVSIATLAWVAALAATFIVAPRGGRAALGTVLASAAAVLLVLGSIKQSAAGNEVWRLHAADLRAARAGLAAGDPRALKLVYPHPELATDFLREMAQVHDGMFRPAPGAR
jgi:hypothetical protein